ncbi:MFS transporter [Streptococcus saliviloxodontae]|uniref:EmrB/QacA subfamily drug resistance transporter n=1 Tax=Streptococcus saliviloxodontae TaxID=1349416 RepID=A0ABS2PLV6_9STRE|nr:MFS transporter [Streptococcus saliviloxodontae]MBM7636272.1 EmrB/QacA subfamily drug resistance transporter [Streptococcus saliviloxodontae]
MSSETTSKKTIGAIIATALLAFCGILSETSMNVTFSQLSSVFHLELGTLQWITTTYLLAVAVTITTSATLKQNYKERHLFFTSVAFFIAGSLLAISSNHFGIMIAGRVLQGIGTGISMPLMFNIIAERIPHQKMGFYMGMGGLIMGLAPAFGPTYGGFMIAHLDWQWIFIAILPIALLAFLIGASFIENSPLSQEKRPFNWLDFILLALSLSNIILAISSLEAGQLNWTYVIIFVLSLIAFIWRSSKEEQPFLDIKLLADPLVLFGLLPFAIYQFSNLSTNFVIPNFLTIALGVGSSLAGFSLLPGTLIGTLTEPFFGKLYDDRGPKLSLYAGNAIFALALIGLSFFTSSLNLLPIIIIYIVFTIGRNMAFNNTMAAVMKEVPRDKSADITAIFQMVQQFAGALGTALSAIIVDSAGNITQGSQYVFFMLLALVLANFLFFKIMFSHFKAD